MYCINLVWAYNTALFVTCEMIYHRI